MGKKDKPNFPSPPAFQPDPFLTKTQKGLFETGDALRQGRFLDPNDPLVGFLNDLVTPNNDLVTAQLGLAQREIQDRAEDFRLSTVNQLEANNQLTSSVANTALGEINEAFNQDLADVATNFFIADVERAFANKSALFGTGLETLNAVGQRGLQNQQQTNAFAQQNFANQVALENERFDRQQRNSSALANTVGFFTGPIGGALFGGVNSGSQGALSGLEGGQQGANFFTSLFPTTTGGSTFGGGGGFRGIPVQEGQENFLSPTQRQRQNLLQQRSIRGTA